MVGPPGDAPSSLGLASGSSGEAAAGGGFASASPSGAASQQVARLLCAMREVGIFRLATAPECYALKLAQEGCKPEDIHELAAHSRRIAARDPRGLLSMWLKTDRWKAVLSELHSEKARDRKRAREGGSA